MIDKHLKRLKFVIIIEIALRALVSDRFYFLRRNIVPVIQGTLLSQCVCHWGDENQTVSI